MDYLPVEKSIQALFADHIPLSETQSERIARLCSGVLLAGEMHLTKIARFLKGDTQQDSRVRWIERLLKTEFLTPERVYQPVLQAALRSFKEDCWHLVIDRTTLWDGEVDLVTISLNYRKRAIPLVWRRVKFGGASLATYVELVRECVPLIPKSVSVVFHGDTEFGGHKMIRAMREIGWDFILAQPARNHFRQLNNPSTQPLSSLPVTRHRSCHVAHVDLFAEDALGAINIVAFYQPHRVPGSKHQRDYCYLATSLPLHRPIRRLGRRRWGTEPFYRDCKSSGFHITDSRLKHPARQIGLLVIVALVYLWSVCFGRWLCKIGQRRQVDSKRHRHLSLFRIGWDWLVHQLRCDLPCPVMLRLYT